MCKGVQLTHLCFADDLLVFSNGSNSGLFELQRILAQFKKLSGLKSNPSKCEIFFGGIDKDERKVRASRFGYQLGEFPVRYLGVPLISGKLSVAACRPLIDKLLARVKSWQAKSISYAGRIELVGAVLYSITQFWMSIFLLPKSLIKEVEKICSHFVWGVGSGMKLRANVAWQKLAYPKKEGGLGFRDMYSWNRACMIRHIWLILLQEGSIWVAWVIRYKLKGRDLWSYTCTSASWNWKKLLKLRSKVESLISVRSGALLIDNTIMPRYSIRKIWKLIRPCQQRVPWWTILWKGVTIPRNRIITWLLIRGSINTKRKMLKWGFSGDVSCCLCKIGIDDRDHLYVQCMFSRQMFAALFCRYLQMPMVRNWDELMAFLIRKLGGSTEAAESGRAI
ncbi:unnamed protein product [Linum trigynum]|uniref:Reverse transcriptase domain-containing protein n=1 Tax=Linum trigynum TaxID=586398 RepID=A0AAV2D6W7_9ROSI